MGSFANLIISFLDLLETELKALRAGSVGLAILLALVCLACVLAAAALGLIVWAIYLYWRRVLQPPTAALFTGLIFMGIAGALAWSAKKMSR